jgi:hypothetical protein
MLLLFTCRELGPHLHTLAPVAAALAHLYPLGTAVSLAVIHPPFLHKWLQ